MFIQACYWWILHMVADDHDESLCDKMMINNHHDHLKDDLNVNKVAKERG